MELQGGVITKQDRFGIGVSLVFSALQYFFTSGVLPLNHATLFLPPILPFQLNINFPLIRFTTVALRFRRSSNCSKHLLPRDRKDGN